MDYKKIFVKGSCPTKIGGQAVMEGIMMKGEKKRATVIRLPDKRLYMKTQRVSEKKNIMSVPFIRGVAVFVDALVDGMRTLMYSADILEKYDDVENSPYKKSKFDLWLEEKLGKKQAYNLMITTSLIVAVIVTVAVFIIFPTWVLDLLAIVTKNAIILNVVEGILRILLFVGYVLAISKMKEIHRVFQYHGAEHKTIHCFEQGLPLTPENCKTFYTLHPRCGTSFLVFVMVIALVLFSLLGWPNLLVRILSRLLLLPVIAGLSYELLKWTGKSDNLLVKILSMPGLYLQKLTTKEPDYDQLEVAIAAMNGVLDDESPLFEGILESTMEVLS